MPFLPVAPLPDDILQSRIAYDPRASLAAPYVPLAAAFLAGRDTPRDALERGLHAMQQGEPSVRAFVVSDAAAARLLADAATARWAAGRPLSPVDGMPFAVKDMIETIDFATEMNSPLYAGWHARRDAAAVWALRQAGAVIVGKTVTTEFACGNSGPTRNPYDSARTPGGSSSGSAAAVGAGMVALALGTQTQASTLRPASYCGAYALKPSHDALHTGGVTPLSPTQDHLGLIGASLEDVWSSASAIARRAGGTPPHPGLQGPAHVPEARRPRALVRLDMRGWGETDAPSRAAFEEAVAAIARAGVAIIDRRGDPEVEALEQEIVAGSEYSYDIFSWEAQWPLRSYADHGLDRVGKRIHELLDHTARMTPEGYRAALASREGLRRQVEALRARADGFLALCSSGPAIVGHDYTGSRSYPTPWTMVAGPAFALPLLAVDGLPLGLQLAGFRDRDAEACGVARWIRDLLLPDSL
ncbi:amidase [Methylobacterium terricola]|uniref:Amidase n=1 Tax=Methylobacterium terricola TaxID=2583531 RepID=A0A5C4LF19_9HYPH|nr:amidase [Methylobacterium terricola]TNC11603.1 amidase [Methylobacterium terricola]